jgi:hypothetical protein
MVEAWQFILSRNWRRDAKKIVAVWRAKEAEWRRVIGASYLKKAGWSWVWVSTIDSNGRTIWIADAHRGDGNPVSALSGNT